MSKRLITQETPARRVCRLPRWIPAFAGAILVSACQTQAVKPAEVFEPQEAASISELEETLVDQRRTVALQEQRIAELELRLLAKQAEIQRLSVSQEEAIQEVVRVNARLRSRNSKAETVASLAEVKLALKSLESQEGGKLHAEPLQRARQYISMSETALAEGNYAGAHYLVGQARVSLDAAGTDRAEQSAGDVEDSIFALPLRMVVRQTCNVRAGAGLNTKVLYQLESGTPVLATGYRASWIRIRRDAGAEGWIHYSLLEGRP